MDWGVLQVRRRTKQQQHVVQIIDYAIAHGAPIQHAWRCTCGDTEAFRGEDAVMKAWITAERHAKIWGGRIA